MASRVAFSTFVERALYDAGDGFYATGGRAGRGGGDFLTSPEVGPLFGAVLARALDAWWDELGRPDPFVVVEPAPARARSPAPCWRPRPACAGGPPLDPGRALRAPSGPSTSTTSRTSALAPCRPDDRRWTAGGRRPAGRAPRVAPRRATPAPRGRGQRAARQPALRPARAGGPTAGVEVRVAVGADDRGGRGPGPGAAPPDAAARHRPGAAAPPPGPACPSSGGAGAWVAERLARLAPGGHLLVLDYADDHRRPGRAARGPSGSAPTRATGAAATPSTPRASRTSPSRSASTSWPAPSAPPTTTSTRPTFLRGHGLDELVAEARPRGRPAAPPATSPPSAVRSRVSRGRSPHRPDRPGCVPGPPVAGVTEPPEEDEPAGPAPAGAVVDDLVEPRPVRPASWLAGPDRRPRVRGAVRPPLPAPGEHRRPAPAG